MLTATAHLHSTRTTPGLSPRLVPACLVLFLFIYRGSAQLNVTLDFDSLPSSQPGWTYHSQNTSTSETDLFSLNGSTLVQNTLSSNSGSADTIAYYKHPTTGYLPELPWSVRLQARLLQIETLSIEGAFAFDVFLPDGVTRISLTPEGVTSIGDLWEVDTSVVHNYEFLWHPSAPSVLSYWLDGEFVSEVGFMSGWEGATFIRIGDLPFGPDDLDSDANAHAEITHFQFSQVPEPGVSTLLGIGTVALAAVVRARRRTKIHL